MRIPILFLFFIVTLNAQEKDTLSAVSYNNLKTLIKSNIRSNPDKAILYSDYLLKKGLEQNDFAKQCLAHSLKGASFRVLGDVSKALEQQLKAKTLLGNVDDPEILVTVYTALGNTYSDLGDFGNVLPSYFEALKTAEANNLKDKVISLKHNLAYFKDQIGESNEALKLLKESKKLLDEGFVGNGVKSFYSSHNDMLQAMVYSKLNQPDSIIVYAKQGLLKKKKHNDEFSLQGLYNYLGIAYTQKNDFDTALKYLKKSDSLSKIIGNSIVLMEVRHSYASLYYKRKEYEKVISILQSSINITERDSLVYQNNDDNYKLIANAYKEIGDYENANLYFEKYMAKYNANKALYNIIDNGFEQKRVEGFKKELEQLRIEKMKQSKYAKYASLLAILIILSLLLLLLKFYKTKKKNEIKFEALLNKLNVSQEIVDTKDVILGEENSQSISIEIKTQILEGLEKLETQEYFLNKDCNSYNVAKKIKTNTSYLSKVVNSHYQKNFNTYINDLRINYAVLKLKDDAKFRRYSIQSIAEELGYKSSDSFTKYFKKHTGLNPSFFIKQLNNLT
ncbi:helix-turn-helix domain-containing protein [uncultured Lacinutrix sp.]|uniref:helix-turn-helix domain-containing protein n=1 Tax=uncultured Lacinutrix sp. TaxID=574032 RepID=UPI002614506C|nr:helix-turn-helix domain-containing protein [uncultured Lacinutrix sp.]